MNYNIYTQLYQVIPLKYHNISYTFLPKGQKQHIKNHISLFLGKTHFFFFKSNLCQWLYIFKHAQDLYFEKKSQKEFSDLVTELKIFCDNLW